MQTQCHIVPDKTIHVGWILLSVSTLHDNAIKLRDIVTHYVFSRQKLPTLFHLFVVSGMELSGFPETID
ncbi:MAG: hypothetical protein ABFS56_14975 [Pseudomonadota bacterium]